MSLPVRQAIPRAWLDFLGQGSLGVGVDQATSERATANPASLTVLEKVGRLYHSRLIFRWKSGNHEVAHAVLATVLEDLRSLNRRPRTVCIDASNETFHAQALAKACRHLATFRLIKGGEKIEKEGESYNYKTFLAVSYSQAFADGLMTLPPGDWLRDDHRRVKRNGARFEKDLGPNGEHADTFDSGALAFLALQGGGPVQAVAVAVGGNLGAGAGLPFAPPHPGWGTPQTSTFNYYG